MFPMPGKALLWFLFALLIFILDSTYEYRRIKKGKGFQTAPAPVAMVSESVFNLISQLGHAAGGLAVVFGAYSFWAWQGALIAFCLLAFLVAVKEWWWDNKYESVEVRGSNLLDWSMWMAGAALALLLLFVKRHWL